MDSVKYIGLDVHRDTISVAVVDQSGRLVMQSVIPTQTSAILDCVVGIQGSLHVTLEEGTHSAWLYDLLVQRVKKLVVCNPRKNALLKSGSKSDAMAVFRSQAVVRTGKKLYGKRHHDDYLKELDQDGPRRRAEYLYQELDGLQKLRRQARHELIVACRKHPAAKWLQSVPFLGPLRTAVLIGRVKTPHRFRSKRQFWAYCGLALETRDSGEYCVVNGQVERRKRPVLVRGLNWNHNHELKNLFKGAATTASAGSGVFQQFYLGLLNKGMQPEMARLTLARKIAAITLKIWKKGEAFNPEHLKSQAA